MIGWSPFLRLLIQDGAFRRILVLGLNRALFFAEPGLFKDDTEALVGIDSDPFKNLAGYGRLAKWR